MKTFILDKKHDIYIYGAAATGEIVYNILFERGYTITGFFDKRASEIKRYKGIPVIDLDKCIKLANCEKPVIIIIAVKNVFEHEKIAEKLVKIGLQYIIYMPYSAVKGKGDERELKLYNIWNDIMKNTFNEFVEIPVTTEINKYVYKDYSLIYKINDQERISYIPIDVLYTDKKNDKNMWGDIPVLSLIPHINFFRWLDGQAGYDYLEYLDFCIDSAKRRNIKITDEWKKNVIRNRSDVYGNMNEHLERNYDFFIKNAPNVIWNKNGYFNLNSGKHRTAFWIAKGRRFIPVRITEDDYNSWLSASLTDKVIKELKEAEVSELKGPVAHPYFYDISCENKDFYYNFLFEFTYMLTTKSIALYQNVNFDKLGLVLSVDDDGFLGRTFRRFGLNIKEYSISKLNYILRDIGKVDCFNKPNIDYSYEFAVIDYTYSNIEQIKNENRKLKYIVCMYEEDIKEEVEQIFSDRKNQIVNYKRSVKDGTLVNILWVENKNNVVW